MTKSQFNRAKILLLTILCLVGGLGIMRAAAQSEDLPPVRSQVGEIIKGAIVSLERVVLGGVEQTILIRGAGPDLPVLLFLHGGPGGSVMPWVDLFHTPLLEENFLVVHWDQRGAGASFSPALKTEDISAAQLVADTLELTDLLRDRFGQDRIFLSGHSWGSALGFLTLQDDATPFHAFIATGERVDWDRSMIMGYEWAKDQARANGDDAILAQLEAIAPFDAFDEADLSVQRDAIDYYRGGDYHTEGLWDQYLAYAVNGQSPYYTDEQVQNYIPGLEFSAAAVENRELLKAYDLFATTPRIDIPVHFITGAEDHNTPGDLAHAYFEALDTPAKSFTRVEGAAHMVMFEKPDVWAETLVAIKDQTLASD